MPARCPSKEGGSSAHRTQGVNQRAALKAGESHCHCRQEQRLLKPSVPTQGIVNIGSGPPCPIAQNSSVLTAAHGSALSWKPEACLRCCCELRALSPVWHPEESCPAECKGASLIRMQPSCSWQSDFLQSKECVERPSYPTICYLPFVSTSNHRGSSLCFAQSRALR